jgi:hypothetical protein
MHTGLRLGFFEITLTPPAWSANPICWRKYGHAQRGQHAGTHAPYNVGTKWSIILAIDTGGLVTYLITNSPGTTTIIFYQVRHSQRFFLARFLSWPFTPKGLILTYCSLVYS